MGNILTFARDGLQSFVAGLGTDRDKASTVFYVEPQINDQQLLAAYRSSWLPRKIVDIPALDSCRNWRAWQAENDQIEAIEAEEKRLNIKAKIIEARKKARLFGGAAIYFDVGDDPAEELTLDRVGKDGIRFLTVLTRRQLTAGQIENDPLSPQYGKPKDYKVNSSSGSTTIHPSRLVLFIGAEHPDENAPGQNQGWGDSVLTSVLEAVKQADSTSANIASLVFEAKIDVITLEGMADALRKPGGEAELLTRYRIAATGKGNNGMLVLDGGETYEQKTGNFATLPDIMDRFFQNVSGAADIPMTRLFGQSPGGLNASGLSDLTNYYDHIRSMQELEMGPAMYTLDECIIRSALGSRPEEIWYQWTSLWQMTDKEKSEIGKINAETIKAIFDTGLIPEEVLGKSAVNMMVESGVMPGLDAAYDDWFKANPDPDSDEPPVITRPAATPEPEDVTASDAEPRTLYVHRKLLNAAEVIAHYKRQGVETTLAADDMHVTITFSRTPVDWMKMGQAWQAKLGIEPGGPRLMDQFGPDKQALVMLFSSSELEWRHEGMVEKGASWDWPDYQPHLTISYAFDGEIGNVEPYRGALVFGPEIFAELDEDWSEKVREE